MFDTSMECAAWEDVLTPDFLAPIEAAICAYFSLDSSAVMAAVLACDDARIAELNTEFRGKPVPTNVLSWPAEVLVPPALPAADPSGEIELGDIAIAFETCQSEADQQGKPLKDHACHLLVHGVLHLLGYDHERDEDATIMEALEVEILGKLGVSNPYT